LFRKFQYLAIAGFLLFVVSALSAQTAQELRLGSSVSATLREGDERWYSVRVTEECFVAVETSGSVDTYLEAYDATGNLIARDDDGGENSNAKVEFYASPGGTYRLKLRGYNNSESGPYRIWASQKPLPQPAELRVGSSHSGNIVEGEDYWYRVTPSGAGFLVVETSGNIDTYLEVYDSSYNFITENDDGGDGNNARLEFFIDTGKTYLLRLKGYNSNESGPYRITASQKPLPNPTELRVGSSHSGNLSGGGENWYRIAPSGVGFLVVEVSSDMDTFLEAYDSSYNLITYDDDGGEDGNARLELYIETGKTYLLKLKGYSSNESGPYRIMASQTPPPAELRIGASHPGNLGEGESNWYRVTPSGSGLLVIEISSEMDTFLEAYDTSNNFIGYDDDGGDYGNARLELFVDAGKTYLIKLRTYDMTESGPYRLWVSFENVR